PLFPYFKDAPNAFKVLVGEFVNTDEGTGVVHIAPGFGEDDQKLCAEHGIEIVCPVDAAGRFTSEVSDFEGQNVLESNKNVIKNLKERGVLVKHETYVHNYPHCWRTDTPLIYRAISSWYVEVTKFRDRLGELNKQINWIPDHIRDGQFGKWLENARDWSISRNRFWGSPIPVWKSDNPDFPRIDVYGSLDELERDFGVRPQNLHRPYIDQLTRPNPDDPSGKSTMRRVEEVLDCWFESGSMPYAQVHYPFENKEWFENHFPADFIVEYVAQTRGWFYNLVVLAGALFDCPPFRNCMCHGVVLDENGQKLSKRLKNYPSPEEVFEKHGSDALRWYLVSSAILNGGDLQIDRDGKGIGEVVRTVLNPIWNAYYFFTLYANSDGIRAEYDTSSPELLDRYILSKTRELVEKTSALMDSYALAGACQAILQYVDALNNWYIRRSRDRFWKAEKDEDKRRAYNTLFVALINLTKVAAPLLPFLSEELFKELTGEESVHFANWPDGKDLPDDKDLVAQMDQVRNICSTTLALRESNGLRIRLPLQRLTVAGNGAQALAPYEHLIADEVNVKQVQFSEEIAAFATFQLVVNARELGPKLGSAMKDVLSATRSGEWQLQNDGSVEIAGQKLLAGEYKMALKPKEGEAAQALDSNDLVAVLDINLTQQLEEEGTARDLVRLVQQTRKEAGLHVADHIVLELNLPEELKEVIKKHERYLSEQTLSDKINFTLTAANSFKQSGSLAGKAVEIGVTRI
ncbi:MAG: isoleucine--tRNA ligase, partial [Bdellovibrionales bacterium]|nr:isoleucine--tRNA ligase [Bdellovibrionales bacterium]